MVDGDPDGERNPFASLLAAVPDPVYTLDTDGRITSINRAEGTTGYSREELLGEHASKILTEDSVELWRAVVEALLTDEDREKVTFEVDLLTRDGERRLHENHVALLPPDDDGEIPGTIGVLRDVAEQRAHERELERYRRIVTAMGDGVYVLDAEGRYAEVNEHLLGLMGYDRSTVIGANPSLFHDRQEIERFEAAIATLVEGARQVATVEATLETADGEDVPIEVNLTLLTDEDGRFRGTVGVVRDVSERKERERELRRQNDRLDQFASVLGHDLRNPLNLAQGRLELAREEHDGEHLAEVDWGLERMDRLVDDVLTLARQGQTPEDTEPVSIPAAAEAAWTTVDEAGDLVIDPDTGTVEADESRLERLLENLFRNAVEHGSTSPDPHTRQDAAEHGSTSPRSRAREDAEEHGTHGPRVVVGPMADGFYVADDGPGIAEDRRDRVFEQGHTTAEDGTGFGLAIVREIAEAHGWTATVGESESGGARFEFAGVEFVPED